MQSSRSKRARSLSGDLQCVSRALLFTQEFFFCSISEDDAEIEGGGDAENEEGDERDPEVGGHARRGLGGKSDDGWSLDHEISGSMEELHVLFDALRDVISDQISDPK